MTRSINAFSRLLITRSEASVLVSQKLLQMAIIWAVCLKGDQTGGRQAYVMDLRIALVKLTINNYR